MAMRSFAHVEHPHCLQRPVPLSACASHSGQVRQVSCRAAMISGGLGENPDRAKVNALIPTLLDNLIILLSIIQIL